MARHMADNDVTPRTGVVEGAPDLRPSRVHFVDWLRVAVIALVIAHHAGLAYAVNADWLVVDPPGTTWMWPFLTVNASFFMGILFLVSGYFMPASFDRKGAAAFTRGRLVRIGLPLLFFAVFMNIPLGYLRAPGSLGFGDYLETVSNGGLRELYYHLWFLGVLLLLAAVYLVWRLTVRRSDTGGRLRQWAPAGHLAILGFVVVLTAMTWVVRINWSIDDWETLFGVLPVEPARLPQYVLLFAIGALAYRGDWLRRIKTSTGLIWLGIGVAASAGIYLLFMQAPERVPDLLDVGGSNRKSLLLCAWEAFICAGICVGLIVLFRMLLDRPNRFVGAMSAASFAAYIVHLWIVIELQDRMTGVELSALTKFGIVAAAAIALSFGIGYLIRRLPGVSRIL
jgi:surface polysaccharide O-acyltransferase-like enzyme